MPGACPLHLPGSAGLIRVEGWGLSAMESFSCTIVVTGARRLRREVVGEVAVVVALSSLVVCPGGLWCVPTGVVAGRQPLRSFEIFSEKRDVWIGSLPGWRGGQPSAGAAPDGVSPA